MIINSIDDAAMLLRVGGVIAYPTETFYGIGCSAYIDESLRRIYEIKGRALNQALPLIVRDWEQAMELVDVDADISASFEEIANSFWPSSLSICLKASERVSLIVTAGTGKVVVRQSPHRIANLLCEKLGAPLVSTSANRSGEKPARLATEVNVNLAFDTILYSQGDDEPKGGQASTIIELLQNKEVKVLRDGAFDILKLIELGYRVVS